MKIDEAKYADGYLMLKTTDPAAIRMVPGFKSGDYTIEKEKKKRSKDANSFAWEIIGQIASAMSLDKEYIYRAAICNVGALEMVMVQNNAVDAFCRVWGEKGLGWVAQKIDEYNGFSYIECYYGSSVYDSKQMSALIDYLKQDAESIGIQIDSEQMRTLLEEWEKTHG